MDRGHRLRPGGRDWPSSERSWDWPQEPATGPKPRRTWTSSSAARPKLSAWAYAYRADLKIQEKPEAAFILRRLEQARSRLSAGQPLARAGKRQEGPALAEAGRRLAASSEKGDLGARRAAAGPGRRAEIGAALGRTHAFESAGTPLAERRGRRRRRKTWKFASIPRPTAGSAGNRISSVTTKPEISEDGSTWVYRGDWDDVDMVAVFVKGGADCQRLSPADPGLRSGKLGADGCRDRMGIPRREPRRRITAAASRDSSGSRETSPPLAGDSGTATDGPVGLEIAMRERRSRRGIALSLLYIRPAVELVKNLPKFPYGHPRDTRITVWTRSGNFTFLVKSLDKGPILAPEYGFFVAKAGSGKKARHFAAELAAANVKSIREMTREHREATWEEAMREINLPLLPPGTALPPYKQVADPPMQVEVPEQRWTDAWRMGVSQLKNGELTYMDLALEAPRPIHAWTRWDCMTPRPDGWTVSCSGPAPRPTAISTTDRGISASASSFTTRPIIDCPGYDTYELVHNGGTGRILYDLAEHYFLTGDANGSRRTNGGCRRPPSGSSGRGSSIMNGRAQPGGSLAWRDFIRRNISPTAPGARANGNGTRISTPGIAKGCAALPRPWRKSTRTTPRKVSRRVRAVSPSPQEGRRPGRSRSRR